MRIFGVKLTRKHKPASVSDLYVRLGKLEMATYEAKLAVEKKLQVLDTTCNRLERKLYRGSEGKGEEVVTPTNGPEPPPPASMIPGATPPPGY